MGLDMYLSKRRYVKNWDFEVEKNPENKYDVTVRQGGKLIKGAMPIKEVVYEAGYWRKANQIHTWFVNNVQDGEDDCKEYWVSKEQLQGLLDLCRQVKTVAKLKKSKVANGQTYDQATGKWKDNLEEGEVITNPEEVAELLPAQSGFFFGSTDYDQWYMQDIDHTIEILEVCVKEDDGDYYYQSSW